MILLKIDRRDSFSNSSIEMMLKCRKKRDVTLRPAYRGDSIEHMIYKLYTKFPESIHLKNKRLSTHSQYEFYVKNLRNKPVTQ